MPDAAAPDARNSPKTSDLCDRLAGAVHVCLAPLRSFGGRRSAAGTISCIRSFEDAGIVRARLSQAGEGRILVVDGGGSPRVALLGDNMARLAIDNGWQGVVIHGGVRDVAELATMDLAVLALGAVPVRGSRDGLGECDVALSFGSVTFVPGHFMCLDEDGVVVMPARP